MPSTSTHAAPTPAQHECVISLGSNIDPEEHFIEALEILDSECDLVARSDAVRTTPVGFQQQPDFLNAALVVRTTLERDEFKAYLKEVEQRLGRVRGPIKSGPRTMDLDIVVWDGKVVDDGYYRHQYVRGPVDDVLAASGRSLSTDAAS